MRPSGTINPFPLVRRRQTPHHRRLHLLRHHRAPWRRRKLHCRRRHRPIVADVIKGRIVQPRRQRLHLLPRRPRVLSANNSARCNLLLLPQLPRRRHRRLRANGVSSARHNLHKLRHLHPLRRRHRCLRANSVDSARHNPHKLRRLRLLVRLQRCRQKRLRANNVSSAHHNRHKLRRLHPLRHRHRCLRADNVSNGLSVHRNRRKLRRLRLLLRPQRRCQSRRPLRQRLQQNRPIPITAKNRTATGKTIGPVRPDPVHRIGCAIFERENSDLRLSLGSSRCASRSAASGSV
jgi:hypothetical protein